MKLQYLLDTNIISQAMRPHPDYKLLENLERHRSEIATATIVFHELLYGCLRLPPSKKREIYFEYIDRVVLKMPIIGYDRKSAQWHAEQRSRLSKTGRIPAYADGQIASIAFSNNLVLVTNNIADFQDFENLQIENWLNEG